ncbi:nicotinamide-nucleotide adenylyltransferase [Candidatus Woesearchaeota archaeon]|nr:nicotinamide-nucleotide adenylyltransferase [Candidatus Woesearchaeota archaeon]
MKTGFYIARFQPLHIGHLSVIKQMLNTVDHVVIGIGSAQERNTLENPFSADEREVMVKLALGDDCKKCSIVKIPDINNYSEWVGHVESLCPSFDNVWTRNNIVKQLFEEKGYEVVEPEFEKIVSATEVRSMMDKDGNWGAYVPENVADTLETIKGVARIKRLYRERFVNPVPTADIIIEVYDGSERLEGIVLIERNEKPFGWAIPGGHQEYGDSLEKTAILEAEEETGLNVELVEQLGTYSDPDRDPRGHKNSTVFIAKAYGKPNAGSDAKNAKIFPLDKLPAELAFDHGKIIEDYKKRKGL